MEDISIPVLKFVHMFQKFRLHKDFSLFVSLRLYVFTAFQTRVNYTVKDIINLKK